MKHHLYILLLVFLPAVSYGQNQTNENNNSGGSVNIDVSKIDKALGKVVNAGINILNGTVKEVQQFIDEIPQEEKDKAKEIVSTGKTKLKKTGRYILDCMHAGWSAGWRGEEYVRPYDWPQPSQTD